MKPANCRSLVRAAIAAAFWIGLAANSVFAETALVIDPTEGLEQLKQPAAAPKATAQPDAAPKRERRRAEAEQRRRAKAEARARAAEKESDKLRAIEQARQADAAARESAARAEARKVAANQAAAARVSAAKLAARLAVEKAAAAKVAAAREAAAQELAAREASAREAAAREAAAKDAAAKEAVVRENGVKLLAARETAAREARRLKELPHFGTAFRDCTGCPELVWLPQGEFVMGDASATTGSRPVVAINYMLAVGRFEVTFAEWDACVAARGCRRRPHDAGWGRGWQPVINVSWVDAQQYVAWLSRRTNKRYRLLSESEWEYSARAGTEVHFWWGDHVSRGDANCAGCGSKWDGRQAAPVGRFMPNPFGLHDMHGNVSEWVEDCYHEHLRDAPVDGRAWTSGCAAATDTRIVRGGYWHGSARSTRSSSRTSAASDYFDNGIGFRIARTE